MDWTKMEAKEEDVEEEGEEGEVGVELVAPLVDRSSMYSPLLLNKKKALV